MHAGLDLPYIVKPELGPIITGGPDLEAENANLSLLPISRSGALQHLLILNLNRLPA